MKLWDCGVETTKDEHELEQARTGCTIYARVIHGPFEGCGEAQAAAALNTGSMGRAILYAYANDATNEELRQLAESLVDLCVIRYGAVRAKPGSVELSRKPADGLSATR